jgi:hypothetical protein
MQTPQPAAVASAAWVAFGLQGLWRITAFDATSQAMRPDFLCQLDSIPITAQVGDIAVLPQGDIVVSQQALKACKAHDDALCCDTCCSTEPHDLNRSAASATAAGACGVLSGADSV